MPRPADAETVGHHDQQGALVRQRQLNPEKPRVRLRPAPQRGHRAEIVASRDDRHPDRRSGPSRRTQHAAQPQLICDRNLGVGGNEQRLIHEHVAARISVSSSQRGKTSSTERRDQCQRQNAPADPNELHQIRPRSRTTPSGYRRGRIRAQQAQIAMGQRCHTGTTLICMPTKRRRHAITETPLVQAALDELRQELGEDSVELGELVVLGAGVKLEAIRSERLGDAAKRRRLADRVRSRTTGPTSWPPTRSARAVGRALDGRPHTRQLGLGAT